MHDRGQPFQPSRVHSGHNLIASAKSAVARLGWLAGLDLSSKPVSSRIRYGPVHDQTQLRLEAVNGETAMNRDKMNCTNINHLLGACVIVLRRHASVGGRRGFVVAAFCAPVEIDRAILTTLHDIASHQPLLTTICPVSNRVER